MYFRKNKADRVVSLDQNGLHSMVSEAKTEDNTDIEKRMMNAVQQLPETDIHLIELRFFEKRSFAEVGAIIGITENSAKVKVYRILEKLKKIIGKRD